MWEGEGEVKGMGEIVKGEAVGEGESPRRRRVCTVLGSWRGLVTRMEICAIGKRIACFWEFPQLEAL